MIVVEASRPPLLCRECDGTGTVEEAYCPEGCPSFGRAPSCRHETVRPVQCPEPLCADGVVLCPVRNCWENAVVRTPAGPRCADHEDDAAAGSLQPPLEVAGTPEGFERNTAGTCDGPGTEARETKGRFLT